MTESYESLHEEEAKDEALVVKERADGKSLCPKAKTKLAGQFLEPGVAALYARSLLKSRKFIAADFAKHGWEGDDQELKRTTWEGRTRGRHSTTTLDQSQRPFCKNYGRRFARKTQIG